MMKTKWRFIFLVTLIFIMFVSYKILEPEMFKNRLREGNSDYEVDLRNFIDPDDAEAIKKTFNPHPDIDSANGVERIAPTNVTLSIDQVIKSMSERFTPVYTQPLIGKSPWDVAAGWVSPRQIHPENPPELGPILQAMSDATITKADVGHKGTQLKLTLLLDGKQKVVFKPAWYPRDKVITGTPYEGRDRHNGEIAAFHLGRILELRRTPIAIGRRLDVHKEILSVATTTLSKTFFEQDGELCFFGKCHYCKGPEDGVCGTGGSLEGTLILWLPDKYKMKKHRHPWSRTYRKGVEPKWAQRDDWCDLVNQHQNYKDKPLLLDIIDTAIFDYLIGNADRHMFETFEGLPESMLIMLDNGKSFGNPFHDERSILAPLYQCCMVRSHIWQRLLALQDGVLSGVLLKVMSHDPVAPVLSTEHLEALDRRVRNVIKHIEICIEKVGVQVIVIDNLPDQEEEEEKDEVKEEEEDDEGKDEDEDERRGGGGRR